MRRLLALRHRDVLREVSLELQRRAGNFICIYPAKGSDHYDQFFSQTRPLNKFVFKMLFTPELFKELKQESGPIARELLAQADTHPPTLSQDKA